MKTLFALFSGKKTYLAALALLVYALIEGKTETAMEAVALLFLRAGVSKASPSPGNGSNGKSGVLGVLLVALVILPGCSVVRVHNIRPDGTKTTACAYLPAWPWQDAHKSIEKMTVSSRTNYFQTSLKGLDEQTETSTNAAALVEAISSGIITGAIKAATGKP